MPYKAILFDFETLGTTPSSVALDLSAIVFNIEDEDDFSTLVNTRERIFTVKFEVASQVKMGRTICKEALAWWDKQSDTAKQVLKPTSHDVSLKEGIDQFETYLKYHKVDGKTLGFVRGASFDFPLIDNIAVMLDIQGYDLGCFPVKFWNQRDVRTAISFALNTIDNTRCPLPVGFFKDFTKHNSVHDCARDVISLQTAWAYSNGTKQIPDQFELN